MYNKQESNNMIILRRDNSPLELLGSRTTICKETKRKINDYTAASIYQDIIVR
jgi:hypothetical protein